MLFNVLILLILMITSFQNGLYQLVTDQGFLTESIVVWETLSNIENDGEFVDSNFVRVPPKASMADSSQQQVDQDYLLALSLQEEAKKEEQVQMQWETFKEDKGMGGRFGDSPEFPVTEFQSLKFFYSIPY